MSHTESTPPTRHKKTAKRRRTPHARFVGETARALSEVFAADKPDAPRRRAAFGALCRMAAHLIEDPTAAPLLASGFYRAACDGWREFREARGEWLDDAFDRETCDRHALVLYAVAVLTGDGYAAHVEASRSVGHRATVEAYRALLADAPDEEWPEVIGAGGAADE